MNFLEVLQVAFILLKIVGLITWSWGLVFIPFYVYLLFLIAYVVITE